jgi:hypothetical protein
MQIIIILFLLLILSILCYHLVFFYKRRTLIYDILQAWQQKLQKKGEIRFDGIGRYRHDYYLCFTKTNNYSTHIHLITDTPKLCYIAKKNNKHSKLYIIDMHKKPDKIVSEMLDVFYKL